MLNLENLEREDEARINSIAQAFANGKDLATSDIFSSRVVSQSFEMPKVFLTCFDTKQILLNAPFTSSIYVSVCPFCTCVRDDAHDLDVLAHEGIIVPVLAAPYSRYPGEFVSRIINFPHVTYNEALFARFRELSKVGGARICPHCIEERRQELESLLRGTDPVSESVATVSQLLRNLHPFIEPDFELIDEFRDAIKAGDNERADRIFELSRAVREFRTLQAFRSRSILSSSHLPNLIHQIDSATSEFTDNDLSDLNEALLDALEMYVPEGVDVSEFITTIGPFRAELTNVVESLIAGSGVDGHMSTVEMRARLGDLNCKVISLATNKRFLLYRAAMAFVGANKTLIASGLLASVLGLTDNLIPCGVSIAGGIGASFLKSKIKITLPSEVTDLGEQVRHSVRPYLHRLLAKYAHLDLAAIQLCEIKEQLRSASASEILGPKKIVQ